MIYPDEPQKQTLFIHSWINSGSIDLGTSILAILIYTWCFKVSIVFFPLLIHWLSVDMYPTQVGIQSSYQDRSMSINPLLIPFFPATNLHLVCGFPSQVQQLVPAGGPEAVREPRFTFGCGKKPREKHRKLDISWDFCQMKFQFRIYSCCLCFFLGCHQLWHLIRIYSSFFLVAISCGIWLG